MAHNTDGDLACVVEEALGPSLDRVARELVRPPSVVPTATRAQAQGLPSGLLRQTICMAVRNTEVVTPPVQAQAQAQAGGGCTRVTCAPQPVPVPVPVHVRLSVLRCVDGQVHRQQHGTGWGWGDFVIYRCSDASSSLCKQLICKQCRSGAETLPVHGCTCTVHGTLAAGALELILFGRCTCTVHGTLAASALELILFGRFSTSTGGWASRSQHVPEGGDAGHCIARGIVDGHPEVEPEALKAVL